VWGNGLKILEQFFAMLFTVNINFPLILENFLLNLNILTEAFLEIIFPVIGWCSPASIPNLLQWKYVQMYLLQVAFAGSQAALYLYFQGQTHRYRLTEKSFQN